MDRSKEVAPPTKTRRPWDPPALKEVGTVGDVLRGGSGKSNVSSADMGDSLKPKGQG
jgi:hypothetical protein